MSLIPKEKIRFYYIDFDYEAKRENLQKERECKGICEYCEKQTGTEKWRGAATAYDWDTFHYLEDPNRSLFMCDECAEAYYDHWNAMWAEVPRGYC